MIISEAKKRKGQYCCAHRCKNGPIKKLGGLCSKHYKRKEKKQDPVRARYYNFRGNALRRGKDFSITLDQFRSFCKRTGYIIEKGKRGKNATIDRINNELGYHIHNIQLLTHLQNCRKGTDSWEPSEAEFIEWNY